VIGAVGLAGWILEPLGYGFMQRGLAASVMVGVVCSVIGCYVVLRGMAFLGDAMAHAILPGVAVAYLLGVNVLLGAAVAAVVVAVLIGLVSRQGVVKEDTAIGILFAAALSLGVALISTMRTYAVDLTHILFGNVLGVSSTDLWLIAGLAVVVLGTIGLLYKELLVVTFDPVLATALRLPVERFRHLLLVLLALTVVASLPTVGVGLVAAMLVTPGATAFLVTRRLPTMMLVAAAIGAGSAVVGLYVSYYANVASGAAVVLTATVVFAVAYLVSSRRRLVRLAVLLVPLAATVVASACTPGVPGDRPDVSPAGGTAGDVATAGAPGGVQLDVLAAESFLADIVRNVAGERARVTSLVPIGVDPHAFEPTPSDLRKVVAADILVVNGAGLETFLGSLIDASAGNRPVIEASAGLTSREATADEAPPAHKGESVAAAGVHETDPHFWLDPVLVETYADNIRDGLTAIDPADASVYATNAAAYRRRLADLDAEIRSLIDTVPESDRLMVTNHDDLGYLADRYGLRIVGTVIPSVSTGASSSARELAALIDRIRASGARTILLEVGASPDLADQVARETGARVVTDLYTHSVTAPDGPAPTYIDMMRANARAIVAALRGSD
jgi:ABC-type Mn2+/Zn2+ transport system permease subunit/ABC-type Zn uptake system ZnuABC Zn-binding protein ZnuA